MNSFLEISGIITGIIGVYLAIRLSPLCWIISIINVLIYCFLFWIEKLYADSLLQILFCIISLYGWYQWTYNKELLIEKKVMYKASYKEMIFICMIFLLSSFVLGYFLRIYTDASFPELDSTLTCGSLIAQYLQTKKKIQNWIIWILVDIVYVFLFINKGLYSTAALYALYCMMAIRGYKQWKAY